MENGVAAGNTATPRGQPGKWYREPWPWLLMLGPVVVVIAGFVTFWLAAGGSDGLVAEDYYKQGVAINSTLARDQRAALLELRGTLSVEGDTVLRLGAKEDVQLPDRLHLVASHSTRRGLDREVTLVRSGDVWQAGPLPLEDGRWSILVEDEARSWRLVTMLRLPRERFAAIGGEAQ